MFVATGCGDGAKLGDVTGTVTIDGAPVEKGSISFFPVDGQGPATGGEIMAGKYESQAPLGNCKVEIRVPKVVGQKKLYDTADSPVQNILEEVLPPKYNETTELRLEVNAGKNDKNWELTTK
jgi:hypothetical protein